MNLNQYKTDLDNLISLARERTLTADDFGYALVQEQRAIDRLASQIRETDARRLALMETLQSAPQIERSRMSPLSLERITRELSSAAAPSIARAS